MKTYAILYQDINRKGNSFLTIKYENSLDDAIKNGFAEMDKQVNYVVNGHKFLPSSVFKPISWRVEHLPKAQKEGTKLRKFNYIYGLEYARDNYCRYKTEKELINRIIKRCQKKS